MNTAGVWNEGVFERRGNGSGVCIASGITGSGVPVLFGEEPEDIRVCGGAK
jgi:hypothetical protein